MKSPIIFSVISTILLALNVPFWFYANTQKSGISRLNTSVSQKRVGSRNTGVRDPGIAIPSGHTLLVASDLE